MNEPTRESLTAGLVKCGVPEHMHEGVINYVLNGTGQGGFLHAVLCGDLFWALGNADHINMHSLPNYGMFLHNHVPKACFGSREAVLQWMEMKQEQREAKEKAEGQPSAPR